MQSHDIASCPEFQIEGSITTLQAASRDGSNGEELSGSQLSVINFDRVKTDYARRLNISEPKSVDALCLDPSGDFALIEFKNRRVDKREGYEVCQKAYDSILMLSDISSLLLQGMRKRGTFVLVYNEAKNRDGAVGDDPKKAIQPSESREGLVAHALDRLAKTPQVRFGMEAFKGYCFKNVYTYTEKEFEERFVRPREQREARTYTEVTPE